MPRKPVLSPEAPQPSGGYSQGIVAGGFLYLSGQGPYDAVGRRASATTIAEQVRQVLENLDAVARAAGGSLQNAVRVRHVHQRHGALRRDGRRVPPVLLRPDAGADDDPVGSGRLRRRGRRGRLARRLTWTSTVARHAGRDGRPRRGRAQHRADAGLLRRARPRLPAAHQDAQAAGDRAHAGAARGGRDHLPEARRGRGDGGRGAARHPAHVPARRRRRRPSGSRRSPARRALRSSATRPRWRAASRRRSPRRGPRSGFLVEVDTGFARTGVQSPEEAAELAALADSLPGLRFDGLMTYPTLPGTGPKLRARDRRDPRRAASRCARSAPAARRRSSPTTRCRRSPRCAPARTSTATARASRTAASRSRTARCGFARRSSAGRRPTAASSTAARRR